MFLIFDLRVKAIISAALIFCIRFIFYLFLIYVINFIFLFDFCFKEALILRKKNIEIAIVDCLIVSFVQIFFSIVSFVFSIIFFQFFNHFLQSRHLFFKTFIHCFRYARAFMTRCMFHHIAKLCRYCS